MSQRRPSGDPWAHAGLVLAICAVAAPATAKPVSFQNGTTVSLEYGAHTHEAQVFTAPHYEYSIGGGYLRIDLDDEDGSAGHAHGAATGADTIDVGYLRLNVLARRWNFPGSQANIFGWGGFGVADAHEMADPQLVPNAGLQLDWESRRFYTALKTDWHSSFAFTHGNSVLTLGVAPYLHDYTGLATWILLEGHMMEGTLHEESGGALLVRLFWRWLWVEAGADNDGDPVGLLMLNF